MSSLDHWELSHFPFYPPREHLAEHLAESRSLPLLPVLLPLLDSLKQIGDGCVGGDERLGGLEVLLGPLVVLHLEGGECTSVERLGLLLGLKGSEFESLGGEQESEGSDDGESKGPEVSKTLLKANDWWSFGRLTRWA